MANRKEEIPKEEIVHSFESQDTELIDESNISLEFPSNSSSAGTANVTPHVENPLSVQNESCSCDPSLLDFSSPNVSTTTACSTPHERKLLCKVPRKRFTLSTDETILPKKQKLFEEEVSDSSGSKTEKESPSTERLDPGSSEVTSSSSDLKYLQRGLNILQSEAKSSSFTTQKVVSTNSSLDSLEGIMEVGKANSSQPSQNPLRKAFSDDYRETDVATLKLRITELEQQVLLLSRQKKDENKDQQIEQHWRHAAEKFVCSFFYAFDETAGEITSIALKQALKADFIDHKHSRLSISSGSLADSSGSETHNHARGASLASTYSCSTSMTSSTSSIPSQPGRPAFNQFRIPQIPEPKRHYSFKYPKSCVCQCYCSAFIDCLAKQPLRCITPETSSSSLETCRPDHQDFTSLSYQTTYPRQDLPSEPNLGSEKAGLPPVDISDDTTTVFRTRSSIYIPISTNLPVFAKWPSNSVRYPGIIENATEETWHTSSHLQVVFCDGTEKKILSENLFPAHFLPVGTEISFEKDDVCETAKLISIQRLVNNELVFLGEVKGIEEIVNIPFEKIFISDSCYKGLKKSRESTLTPKKTPRFSLSEANVTEGKRTSRKVVKFEGYSKPNPGSSMGRKTTRKGKRVRPTTDTSSSDVPKSDKKKPRSLSQRKSAQKKAADQTATPQEVSQEKGHVYRKLYADTPCCSKPPTTESVNAPETLLNVSSTDTDTSITRDVSLDKVCGSDLDQEEVRHVSRRVLVSKSSKREVLCPKDDSRKGPIPEKSIFLVYNFVLTQSKPKKNSVEKLKKPQDSCSEEGSFSDCENYYSLSDVPFDSVRLKEQILAGGGKVFRSILDVPREDHDKTILITDNIVETPNYLLALSLQIPIFRHDLIINSCIQNKHVSLMLANSMSLPAGRSISTGIWVHKASSQPFVGSSCFLALSTNKSTINFWWHILNNTGAKVILNKNFQNLISEFHSVLTFIVGDKSTPKELLQAAQEHDIPVVSTLWVIQTLIHGKLQRHDLNRAFIIPFTSSDS